MQIFLYDMQEECLQGRKQVNEITVRFMDRDVISSR